MTIKRCFLIVCLLFIPALHAWPLAKSRSLEDIRTAGTKRTYIFFLNDRQLGRLESIYDGKTRFENMRCHKYTERLSLDYTPFGHQYSVKIENEHFIDERGRYVGDDMHFKADNQDQRLYLFADEDSLIGYFERKGRKEDISRPLGRNFFSLDNNMIDQYEVFLSFHDINVGDRISDTVFVPQTLLKTPVTASVDGFDWVSYGRLYDSAYICRFVEPAEQLVYFTKDRKVIRVDQISQGTRIILFESPLEKMAPRKSSYTIVDFFRRIPLYIIFLIFGVIFVSPFIGRYYKRIEFYLALLLGGATFAAAKQLIFPLQKWYGSEILIPAVESGGSLYYYAIYTALISGLLYETIKLLPIALVYFSKKPNRRYAIALGVICGLGFGIYGAGSFTGSAYQTGTLKIVSWPVFEQIVFILFSATAGAAFGFGFSRGARNLLPLWMIMVVIRAFSDYLVVFFQKSVFDMPILQLIRALVCVLTIAAIYIVIKKAGK